MPRIRSEVFIFINSDMSKSFLRLCEIKKQSNGSCGFHLSRTQWDPYPWVSDVDNKSPAHAAGLRVGDCVLEVNGEDVLGLRITEVAEKVKNKSSDVCLLVWNSSVLEGDDSEPILNLQKFSSYFQSVLQLLECPVCFDVATFPTYQCINGHILCGKCRPKTQKCPICRAFFSGRGRCLLAEKLHFLLVNTFTNHRIGDDNDKLVIPNKKINNCKYYCPWNGKCTKTTSEENQLFIHLQEHSCGPFIHYFLKSSAVKVQLPENGLVYIKSIKDKTIFFVQWDSDRNVWLSVLGDDTKASNYHLKILSEKLSVNSLTFPREEILKNGSYVQVPLNLNEITIEILIKKKQLI